MMVDTQITNKKLIDEYPWLCPERTDDGKVADYYDYSYTELDFLPQGWRDMALDYCKDLKTLLDDHGLTDVYALSEVKEKWGALCWYDYLLDFRCEMPWDITALNYDYFDRSKRTCPICGAEKCVEQQFCDGCIKDREDERFN